MVLFLNRMCQCGLHSVLWSHIGTLYEPPRCRTSQYRGLLFHSQCPSGTILLTRVRWCRTGGFQEQGQCFFIGLSCSIPTMVFYYFSLSLLSVYRLVLCGLGLRTDMVYISLSLSLALPTFLNNNTNNHYYYMQNVKIKHPWILSQINTYNYEFTLGLTSHGNDEYICCPDVKIDPDVFARCHGAEHCQNCESCSNTSNTCSVQIVRISRSFSFLCLTTTRSIANKQMRSNHCRRYPPQLRIYEYEYKKGNICAWKRRYLLFWFQFRLYIKIETQSKYIINS